MALYYARGHTRGARGETPSKGGGFFGLLPLFAVGFVAMSVFRSVGDAGIKLGGLDFSALQ